MNDIKKPLCNFIHLNCIVSGQLDIKKATLDGKFLSRLKKYFNIVIFPDFREVNILGGSSDGASHIAPALVIANYREQFGPIHCSIVRNVTKDYGARGDLIESKNSGDKNVLIVHDFLDGAAMLNLHHACFNFKNAGYNIKGIVTIVVKDKSLLSYFKEEFQAIAFSIFDYSDFRLDK